MIEGLNQNESDKPRSERCVVTALCYDLIGSTALLQALDIEDYQELITHFLHGADEAISSNSGTLISEAGDGGLALFPIGVEAKDAASLAIRAGFDIIAGCGRAASLVGRRLHVRIGIATSMALVQEQPGGDPILQSVTGPALAMATRLQSLACADCIFVSRETRNLVRRSYQFVFEGNHDIKGFAKIQPVWRALRRKKEIDRFQAFGHLSTRLVGRDTELRILADSWEETIAGRGQVVLIEGDAGIGKSRLVHELRNATRQSRARLLVFQCLPGGGRSMLHPLLHALPTEDIGGERRLTAHALGQLFHGQGITDNAVIEIFSFLLGAEGSNSALREMDRDAIQRKVSWALRHCIELLCVAGPILLVVEDVHWIDATSRQMLAELSTYAKHFPVLVAVTARGGFSPEWLKEPSLRTIKLMPLDPQQTRQAIRLRWPHDAPPESAGLFDIVERVTGGVPLFIEEVCRWVSELAGQSLETLVIEAAKGHASILESVIEARLAPLGAAQDVARAAAVAGSPFDAKLLARMLPEIDAATITAALEGLTASGLIMRLRPLATNIFGFRHALIQETIYGATLSKRRRTLHTRIFKAVRNERSIAPWMGTATIAEHADKAGSIEDAIELFVASGTETYARSAMTEARQLLDHALALCSQVGDMAKRDALRLDAMAALGPILTSSEGPSSLRARALYQEAVDIARRRPVQERARWFPIFWGWWFTGDDIDGERARALLDDVREVTDGGVQLQARHCIWAIEFYLGRHTGCIAAVEEGLRFYDTQPRPSETVQYGGHDARVCGLAHRGLSLWFTGRAASAVRSLAEAKNWARHVGHVGSLAHIYNNDAMLSCYRRDFSKLRLDIADIRRLTSRHHLPSLSATAQILEGWCEGHAGRVPEGIGMIRDGLAIHRDLQTPEDYPVYCSLLAGLLALDGKSDEGLELLNSAVQQAGHRYWLAEVHRHRAQLLHRCHAEPGLILAALSESLAIASEHNAVPILISSYEALLASKLDAALSTRYRNRVAQARESIEPGEPLYINPEPTAPYDIVR